MKERISDLIDDVNWEIAMFLKHGAKNDGSFASLIVPAAVAFVTAVATVVWCHI